jgi:hypothetical protein
MPPPFAKYFAYKYCLLHACLILDFSSETSTDFHRISLLCIPLGTCDHEHCCEKLKSHMGKHKVLDLHELGALDNDLQCSV